MERAPCAARHPRRAEVSRPAQPPSPARAALTPSTVWMVGCTRTPAPAYLNAEPKPGHTWCPEAILDPRSSILDPRSSILDPRSSILDPRSSILDPRS